MDSFSSEGVIQRRPDLFRALGSSDPPPTISVCGGSFRLDSVLKHDSWAATAVYVNGTGTRIACKLNRQSPIFIMPMAWLGRWLAQREQRVLRLMEGTQGFPRWTGSVSVNGREIPTAVAHDWIAGRPFKPSLMVNDQFFPALQSMIEKLHAHDIAYVDMSKWGNILVGDDGGPYLLDYQIHFRLPRGWPLRWWLRLLQSADMYYFRRHWLRCRPDQVSWDDRMAWSRQPPHVWIAETVGPVFRFARRVVLRMFGAKGDPRKPHSEGAEPRFPGRSD